MELTFVPHWLPRHLQSVQLGIAGCVYTSSCQNQLYPSQWAPVTDVHAATESELETERDIYLSGKATRVAVKTTAARVAQRAPLPSPEAGAAVFLWSAVDYYYGI
jgi:hypothetical protein